MEWEDALKIHNALHSNANTVTAANNKFDIVLSKKNGCRTVNVFGTWWMVQNTKKPSQFTLRAMNGEKLTWIMTKPRWGLIANGELEVWCTALKRPEVKNEDPGTDADEKPIKRRKLNSSQSKATASVSTASELSDPVNSSEDNGTRRLTRSLSRAQNNNAKVKSEDDNENTIKAEYTNMSNEPSSDLFSDGDTERVVYAQKKIQGSGLSSDFSVISLNKQGSNMSSNSNENTSGNNNMDSDNKNDMEVDEDESTIAYNNNKTAPKKAESNNDVEDESTIVYNNNNKPVANNNNNNNVPEAKKEPPKPAAAKKKGSMYNKNKGSNDIIPVWQIDFTELALGDKLGAGAFGEVRKGRYRGTDVAIKILHTQDEENTAMFFKEAELMCKLRHPNVIQCLGASVAPPNLSIVMELMNSNLSRLIRSGPADHKVMIKVAIGIARGINFLHTAKPKIIHRDLKPDNILLDDNHVPKIADFGVSRENFATETMTRIGTPAYCAPEILNNMKYNEKVDIFSFGMMLHSMVTGGPPFSKSGPKGTPLAALQIMMKLAVQKERPPMPDSIFPEIKELIEACWQHDPKDRPTSEEILFKLENVIYPKYWPSK